MAKVIKRGGRRQNFIGAKIIRSVAKPAREAGLSPSGAKEAVNEVAKPVIDFYRKKRFVKTVDLRKSILRRLGRRKKSIASVWRRHERKKKRK